MLHAASTKLPSALATSTRKVRDGAARPFVRSVSSAKSRNART
ncbi:hypothetical protein PXO_01418 [Xanthomonas oryzae pv. oryzae PXO99A]|uniref:Uncharacterized protein n=1 Tax=Xanthomonas oryzae pv. oryzae (strain PXO99A) TaxID=360094 RepID=A0A0K0GMG3_XANOP|nr:hypothetical protein PXO_01418 [Xanthomonas oryzae pv. oryzae PXO99A]